MKKKNFRRSLATMSFLFAMFLAASVLSAHAATIYGVTNSNQLIRFDSATPGTTVTVGTISGLQSGENILGIDFRPATGELFALGSTSRLYVVSKTTGAATSVGVLTTALSGTEFGMDFNPTVDRIRIVSNTGQNLRVNPTNGMVTVDGALNPGTPVVTAAAYTNNFNGATTTTLYDIDTNTDTLFTQNPPNNGTLVPVGVLGVNATDVNGFDISAGDGTAYAALTVGSATNLYTVNLTLGLATSVGAIGGGSSLRGLSVESGTSANYLVYGVTTANNLVRFNSSRPNTLLSTVAITGLQSGENVLGLDFRPATGQLFALGSASRIYRINTATGAATFVGTLTTTLSGTNFGFDFNPVPDRIRITSDSDQNLRANPADGTNLVDGTLAFAAGDVNAAQNPNVVASGYTNSFAGTTTTTLYNIDSNLDILVRQDPPNNGTLNTIGSLGLNTTGEAGFDIAAGNNQALAALQVNGATASGLYSINLMTGATSPLGPIGGGVVIRDIAIGTSVAGAANSTVDFDGDRKTDFSIFRLSNENWYINNSSNNSLSVFQFGSVQTDVFTPGDYDGDGKTDAAVWRTTNGVFYVLRSSDNAVQFFQFGLPGDEPVARDYDGDGRTDFAVVRRSGGSITWFITNSSNNSFRAEQFGIESDVVAPGDYDGDGRSDLAIHRGIPGQPATFFIQQSTAGFRAIQWGLGGDLVTPGDYDGDGKTDFAVVRQGTPYTWYVLRSSDLTLYAVGFGTKPHFTAQGDYDGDGKTDPAIFDPTNGYFYYFRSSNPNTISFQFGQNGDYPIANFDTH